MTGEWIALASSYDQRKAEADALTAECDRIKLAVREHMKGRSRALLPDGSEWRLARRNAKNGSRALTRKTGPTGGDE